MTVVIAGVIPLDVTTHRRRLGVNGMAFVVLRAVLVVVCHIPKLLEGLSTDQPFDGLGGLGNHPVCPFDVAGLGGLTDTMPEVFVQEPNGNTLQGRRHRVDLSEDVDAIGVLTD